MSRILGGVPAWVHKVTKEIECLQDENTRLKKQIEKMKCCHNCKNLDDCPREYTDCLCNHWEVEEYD